MNPKFKKSYKKKDTIINTPASYQKMLDELTRQYKRETDVFVRVDLLGEMDKLKIKLLK